jgi:hypothetical protein
VSRRPVLFAVTLIFALAPAAMWAERQDRVAIVGRLAVIGGLNDQ